MMTALYAFSAYVLLRFIARFICLNGLIYCDCDKVGLGGNAGFHAIEGHWEGVTANHSCIALKQKDEYA